MTTELRAISSKATQSLLEDLFDQYADSRQIHTVLESVGGVVATQRILDGAIFDIAILSYAAMQTLSDANRIIPRSRVELMLSPVAIAVPSGHPHPPVNSAASLRETLLAASSIGLSSGPSGVALRGLFEQWGIQERLANRIKMLPPGVPVGSLLASGEVELGFQQYSELKQLPDIEVIGFMPEELGIESLFCGAICTNSSSVEAASALLDYLRSSETDDLKRHHGMKPL